MARHPLRDCWAIELPVLLLLLLRPPQTPGKGGNPGLAMGYPSWSFTAISRNHERGSPSPRRKAVQMLQSRQSPQRPGKTTPSIPSDKSTTCSTPTSIEHANIQVKSYNENSRERYICNSGFKRKAGTSSLTKCLRNEDTNITQWTIPTLICIKPAFISKPDTTVATKPAVVPGSRLTSKSPAGTTGVVRNEPSQAPPQTTAKALEHTPSTSLEKPGSHSSSSTAVTVATIATPVTVLCGACVVLLLVCYHKKSRQTSQTPSDQVENMEDIPMTGGNNGREEDTENYHTV
ncbi:interleukin-15 receptor subunit alpha isoform X4 [Myotis myotis]|uniref:interleukin-15 receptor subunit alpha isoform X4 n=1 Tax=Myotis myotis TaxID=51298 RepID=UPI00174D43FC|nr:interleukin-15 receptor subunit alpha isoform X4 [Myotis myotis]